MSAGERHRSAPGAAQDGSGPAHEVRQPFAAPSSQTEERAWRSAGLLVDLAGRPLPTAAVPCAFCDGDDLGDTCPAALTCRTCGAEPGKRCLRPSEHTADRWHHARIRAAELEDQRRQNAKDITLPAPWMT